MIGRVGLTTMSMLLVATTTITMGPPSAHADDLPTRDECAAGGHDGAHLDEEAVFPGVICVSANGQEGVYVGGDPTMPCGTVAAAGVTITDTVEGDPERCAALTGTVREWGYITTRDGTRLRYTTIRPDVSGPVPVAMIVSTYYEGIDPPLGDVGGPLLEAGYAIVGVNIRGTGCSQGVYDIFRPYEDLYDAIEWAGAQAWSTGDVGMFGASAPGLSQLYTASTRPPSLRAIAPNELVSHVYRDFVYPGGILNVGYGYAWGAGIQAVAAATAYDRAVAEGDHDCLVHQGSGGTEDPTRTGDRSVEELKRPYTDEWYEERSAITWVDRIDVPVLACLAWQDDQVLSSTAWLDRLDRRKLWTVFTNGYHGACDWGPALQDLTVAFFDEFVHPDRHVDFKRIPRVQIWHESTGWDATEPSWITTHRSWPPRTRERVLHLGDGALLDAPPATDGSSPYLYPFGATSQEASNLAEEELLWSAAPPVPGGYAAWTTAPLTRDVEVFGSASLDVWLSSTASDTDLQVTLTEVRPDGQEMYLRRGWLRASHRALDRGASTATRPVHTHRERDAAPLPDEPTLVRVEIPPLNHVFREGSAIRVTVDAPTGRTGLWQFAFNPTPALNTIHHGPDYPSRLVLGVIPRGAAPADKPLPPCGEVLRTPCRDDPLAVAPVVAAPAMGTRPSTGPSRSARPRTVVGG